MKKRSSKTTGKLWNGGEALKCFKVPGSSRIGACPIKLDHLEKAKAVTMVRLFTPLDEDYGT